jgi:hypothetical protein
MALAGVIKVVRENAKGNMVVDIGQHCFQSLHLDHVPVGVKGMIHISYLTWHPVG